VPNFAITADSRRSLQVRGGKTSTARADIHITEDLSFFLHRRKAVWKPKPAASQWVNLALAA